MDTLRAMALNLWPDLMREIGEPPGGWRDMPLARRQDPRVAMIALRMVRGTRALVLKLQDRPRDRDGFAVACEAHIAAHQAYPRGVPGLLTANLDQQVQVMDFVDGALLSHVLTEAPPAAQSEALFCAGAWLDGYHRATWVEARQFQPKFTLNYLREIVSEVRNGKRAVAEPARFLICAEKLCAMQAAFEGRQTQVAATHGDLHMRNLIIGARTMGIDFTAGRSVPVGHDIGRLLTDYAIVHAPTTRIRPGEVLPDFARDGFFSGYTLTGPEDPSVQLLLRHRLLAEWWGLPVEGRSLAQARRLHGVLAVAARAFPGA